METLCTIGHSTLELPQFLRILAWHAVQLLVDVRTVPRSRRNPQFNRDHMRGGASVALPSLPHRGRPSAARNPGAPPLLFRKRNGAPNDGIRKEQEEPARCRRCGLLNPQHVFGSCALCTDRYYLHGSCCLEHGADGLWQS